MYITTFYSFKGGVGRTMAMVNVAMELVKSGRKVLIVDFDLEAPGLDTFDIVKRSTPTTDGIVDYVYAYIETKRSPNIEKYVSRCGVSDKFDGELWLMPAGNPKKNYQKKLGAIDWNYLYEKLDGFLLFEDLKQQWNEVIAPDYVFIDSRTGHSDVCGICTRQLPDAISFFFFPNEQNLRGLERVVNDVDNYSSKIVKHFITSNVPDLDDEDLHLQNMLNRFSTTLGYKDLTAVIHRYSSLSLLNQSVFTVDRPNTRLSQEYRGLTRKIVLNNLEDKEGASEYLWGIINSHAPNYDEDTVTIEDKLKQIQEKHSNNSEILNSLSIISERKGDYEDAFMFIDRSLSCGEETPSHLLRHARLAIVNGKVDLAVLDVRKVFSFSHVEYNDLSQAINLLLKLSPKHVAELAYSNAVSGLSIHTLVRLIEDLLLTREDTLGIAQAILEDRLKRTQMDQAEKMAVRNELALIYISKGLFLEALSILSQSRPSEASDLATLFNYAVAEWGAKKTIPKDLFKLVAKKLLKTSFLDLSINAKQCLSLSLWAIGELEQAKEIALLIRQQSVDSRTRNFSCWSYMTRNSSDFRHDISEMIKMFEGEDVKPLFLSDPVF